MLWRSCVCAWPGLWCLAVSGWWHLGLPPHAAASVLCPSVAPLHWCLVLRRTREPWFVHTAFHIVFSKWWIKKKIYRLCVCHFNLSLRGWGWTESVVNINFKTMMKCFFLLRWHTILFPLLLLLLKKKPQKTNNPPSSCLWFVHKYNIKHLLCASDVRSSPRATVLIHLEDALRVSGLAQYGTGEESDSEKGRGNGIIMKDYFPSYCFLLFIPLSMFPLVISLPEMKITWQENNVSTPIVF